MRHGYLGRKEDAQQQSDRRAVAYAVAGFAVCYVWKGGNLDDLTRALQRANAEKRLPKGTSEN